MNIRYVLIYLFLIVSVFQLIYAEDVGNMVNGLPGYLDGNGQIIDSGENEMFSWYERKHEQKITLGSLAKKSNMILYHETYEYSPIIRYLKKNEIIEITALRYCTYKESTKSRIWLLVDTVSGETGWIDYGRSDPYKEDAWIILERIETTTGRWTVRQFLGEYYYVTENLNVRNIPGLSGSSVLFQLRPEDTHSDVGIQSIALTEETEVIDGMNDHWMKIEDPESRIGWIFAGYAHTDRGGSKYRTPERIVSFSLENY